MIAPTSFGRAPRFALMPTALSALVVLGGTLYSFSSQYYIDYETSLLPWLVQRGWVLYRDAIDQHSPLLPTLLGFTTAGDPMSLHVVIALLHALTLLLVCIVAWRIAGAWGGLIAVVLAELWTVSFDSTHLWYDGVLAPFYLSLILLACAKRPRPPLIYGLLLGLLVGVATLIKQHALLALPLLVYAIIAQRRDNLSLRLAGLFAGFLLPVALAAAYYAAQGALGDALYWTALYTVSSKYTTLAALMPTACEWPVLLALYAPIVAILLVWLRDKSDKRWLWVLLLGLVVIATLPAYPRYGRLHLEGVIPLLAVMAAIAAVRLASIFVHRRHQEAQANRSSVGSAGNAAVLVVGALVLLIFPGVGLNEWRSVVFSGRPNTPEAPYAQSAAPLRAWVDANAPANTPITIFGLDSLLYRVLEREPARPYVPHLAWIDAVPGLDDREWAGIEATKPAVALVSSTGWDGAPVAGTTTIEARLRNSYKEAARYPIVIYQGAPPVEVVCLVRMSNASP